MSLSIGNNFGRRFLISVRGKLGPANQALGFFSFGIYTSNTLKCFKISPETKHFINIFYLINVIYV